MNLHIAYGKKCGIIEYTREHHEPLSYQCWLGVHSVGSAQASSWSHGGLGLGKHPSCWAPPCSALGWAQARVQGCRSCIPAPEIPQTLPCGSMSRSSHSVSIYCSTVHSNNISMQTPTFHVYNYMCKKMLNLHVHQTFDLPLTPSPSISLI